MGSPQGELLLEGGALLLGAWVRLDIVLTHKVEQLTWDLLKDLLGQQVRIPLELVKWHELDDISAHVLTIRLRIESFIISIKLVHRIEIGITDTHNDNSCSEFRSAHDLINGFLHVVNDTIS